MRTKAGSVSVRDWPDRQTNGQARIVHFEIDNGKGEIASSVPFGGSIRFSMRVELNEPIIDPCFGVIVHDQSAEPLLDLRSHHAGLWTGPLEGNVTVRGTLDRVGLYPGTYWLSLWVTDSTCTYPLDWVKLCGKLRVDPHPGRYGDLKLEPSGGSTGSSPTGQ